MLKKSLKISLIFLLIPFAITITPSSDNVIFIVEMARHGARAPVDSIIDVKWINEAGVGELTPVGERQRYLLGLNTKKRYPEFFKKALKFNEYYVRSTSKNRTIMSGFSHIVGIFNEKDAHNLQFENGNSRLNPPQKLLFNPKDLGFNTPLPHKVTPFPIHSRLSSSWDPELGLQFDCPKCQKTIKKSMSEAENELKKEGKFLELIKKTRKIYGLPDDWKKGDKEITKCFKLADFAIMDYYNNNSPRIDPSNPEQKNLFGLLKRCHSLSNYQLFKDLTTSKISISPVLDQIKTCFKAKTKKNKEEFPLRYVHFSAHDLTISPHLTVMKMADNECIIKDLKEGKAEVTDKCPDYPELGSNLIWELIEKDKNYFVKVSYNGVYIDYCRSKEKMGNDFFCKLDEFFEALKNFYIFPNYREYCGVDETGRRVKGLGMVHFVLIGLVGILSISSLVLCVCFLKVRKRFNEAEVKEGLVDTFLTDQDLDNE